MHSSVQYTQPYSKEIFAKGVSYVEFLLGVIIGLIGALILIISSFLRPTIFFTVSFLI